MKLVRTLLCAPAMLRSVRGLPSTQSRLRRCLLIIERGARAVRASDQSAFEETTAVVQMSGEQFEAFSERVFKRLTSLVQAGRGPETVAVILGKGADEVDTCREKLLHQVLEQPGLRTLSLEAQAPSAPPGDVLRLVDGLVGRGTQVLVRLRLGPCEEADEAESGIFWSAPPARP